MTTLAIFSLIVGLLLFVAGWVLNTQTPIQQPLPVVGAALFAIGLLLLIIKAAMP